MKKVFRIIQIVALSLSLVEIIGFGIFISLYISNVGDLQTKCSVDVVGYLTIGIIVLNVIALICFTQAVGVAKKSNDQKTADIVGSEVYEAYKFGKIGFIVINNENKVIWCSELFESLDVSILNEDVFTWCNELQELVQDESNAEKDKTIFIQDYYFRVKYLKENSTFIFEDVTEYESAVTMFKKNSLVLGIIMIDNYTEIAQNNEDVNDLIPQIKNSIALYAKKFNMVLRSYKNDSFFVVCKKEDLERVKKDGVKLLSDVRTLGQREQVNSTLSIGFACDYSTTTQINEMASNALSVAMSRGGDQAVIAEMNKELEFFGGKSESVENRNKVKVKSDANALLNHIEENKDNKILIMGHDMMDMDALGSCLGISEICRYKGCSNYRIVYDAKRVEAKTRSAFNRLFSLNEYIIDKQKAIQECDQNTLLIICDVNAPSIMMCKELLDKTDKVIIVDHHRRGEQFPENLLLSIIDTSASSASELVIEIIKYASKFPPIPVASKVATIMLSGILLDTNRFKSKSTGVRTFEACMVLKEYGADNGLADDLLKDGLEEYKAVTGLVDTLKIPFSEIVTCVGDDEELYDQATLAKAANQCIAISGNRAAFVIGRVSENQVNISARSDGTINVQLICEKIGRGGGHFSSAGSSIEGLSTNEVEKILLETISLVGDDKIRKVNSEGE